jgi:DNA invertase Pin-like site-specific DNA recombinase
MRAVGYLRVSTSEQVESGLGLEAQRAKVGMGAALRDWELVEVIADEGVSGTVAPEGRPGMARALSMLRAGEADALIAAKLDRTSRSAGDFARLMARARAERWHLVLLDVQVDTTTAGGKFVAQVLAAAAELERDLVAERTRDALAAKKRQGARLGRPVSLPDQLRRRIVRLRVRHGWSLPRIAARLNEEGVATAQGGWRWWPETVAAVVRSVRLDGETAA